jgi:hypothetical protein
MYMKSALETPPHEALTRLLQYIYTQTKEVVLILQLKGMKSCSSFQYVYFLQRSTSAPTAILYTHELVRSSPHILQLSTKPGTNSIQDAQHNDNQLWFRETPDSKPSSNNFIPLKHPIR